MNEPTTDAESLARPAAYTPLPRGRVEYAAVGANSRASITGWAFDYDASGPIIVQAYVDGTSYLTWADRPRSDVQKAMGLSHNKAGFTFDLPIPEGDHTLQVFAINVGAGSSQLIYRASLTGRSHNPEGRVEYAAVGANSRASVTGWAFDADASGPIIVQAYVDGTSYLTWADRPRSDVQTAKGLSHNKAGFAFDLPIPEGNHTLQVFAINTGAGSSQLIYRASLTGRSHNPEGRVEYAAVDANSRASVTGWAFDADASGPIIVQAYVDGTSYLTWADRPRSDVQTAKGLSHNKAGFAFDLPIPSGQHSVQVFAINSGRGTSQLIYSGTVYGRSSDPRGRVEWVSYDADKRQASLSGWAFDADASGPVIVQVYVGGNSYLTWADKPRSDVQTAMGLSHNKAGFNISVPVPSGFQSLRVFVINVGGGSSQLIHSQTIGEQIPLFVYGTLRTGQEAEFVLSDYTRNKVTTRSPDVDLWVTPDPRDGSRWPWIMPGSYGTTGEVLYFYQNVASQALARADSWEGYIPGGNPNSMNYTREVISSNQGNVYGYVATPHRQAYIRANGVRVISGDFNRF